MRKNILFSAVCIIGVSVVVTSFQNCSQVSFVDSVQSSQAPRCEVATAASLKPQLDYQWRWFTDIQPTFNQVMATPSVGDIDGDGIPEIAFTSYEGEGYAPPGEGVLRVLNGRTGTSKFSLGSSNSAGLAPAAATTPLLIDIDRDGRSEIIYVDGKGRNLIALNADGTHRWTFPLPFSSLSYAATYIHCVGGAAAAQLDGPNKNASLIIGPWIVDEVNFAPHLRVQLEDQTLWCSSYAASLAPGEAPKIITGRGVLDSNTGQYLWQFAKPGTAAVGSLKLPNYPHESQVVVSGAGNIAIYSKDGLLLSDKPLPSDVKCSSSAVGGGQASIGRFTQNSDAVSIAVATGKNMIVFNNKGEIIDMSTTQDCSSMMTGVSSFDFNGDGSPEIIYSDEKYLRIYTFDSNNKLKILSQIVNPTGTLVEYPVVADVTGDGTSRLLVVSNNMWVGAGNTTDYRLVYDTDEEQAEAARVTGLRAFKSAAGKWMPARKVWNQQAYIPSDVTDQLQSVSGNWTMELASLFKVNIQKDFSQMSCQ